MQNISEKKDTVISILLALSFSHFLNDMVQSLLPAIYPILKHEYTLNFAQIGIITLTYQLTGSLLQPVVGLITDRKPYPYSLPIGMFSTLIGLLTLAYAKNFSFILLGAGLIGLGSSVFHPESSRMARTAAGNKPGFAQSVFQIGGNAGTAVGPLLAAFIILPHGQMSLAWFSLATFAAIITLSYIGRWYQIHHLANARKRKHVEKIAFDRKTITISMTVLMLLVFSKYFYLASITSYFTFYLIHKFHLSTQAAQLHLFLFLAAVAIGTLIGGPIGDRIGRKAVIWYSILGVLPFTLALPYASLPVTSILSVIIGLILSSAFSAIVVYAQELAPGRTGTIAGLFFGLSFGMGGLGAAVCGKLADIHGIDYVYHLVSFLPTLGILTVFLPNPKVREMNLT
ncbi:MAG TPA: MFS transporter [Gammaproteobacteria bacterium]|nr:MFS transporter [Gammaproteobacteria bacterium]